MLIKKQHKYFDFRFENENSLVSLKYQIDQNKTIANTFFEHIKSFLATSSNIESGYTAANGLRYSQSDIDSLLEKLKVNIFSLNKYAHFFDLKKMNMELFSDLTKANLNQVLNLFHEDFEHNMNDLQLKYPKVSTVAKYRDRYLRISEILNTINNTIHEIEGTFYNYINLVQNKNYAGYYSTCLIDDHGWTGPRINLTSQDFAEFTLEQFFGQLVIGYDTTGKNLLHAYWTNDLKIIQEGKITPQTAFGSNVLLYFKSRNLSSDSIYQSFNKWYDEHNIAQYGYSKNISDESLGNITIGRLKYINDEEVDLNSLDLQDKLAIVDRIKNKTLQIYLPILI
ncbi:MAG: hypothetical protein AAGE84_07495 [Cyanobacteria bacterium P01_G01_bin.39]